jgi:hypothetical protein
MTDLLTYLLILAGIAFCWWKVRTCHYEDESSEIEQDMHGNEAHGPHRDGRKYWWARFKF